MNSTDRVAAPATSMLVARRLRNDIVRGKLRPAERLVPFDELADRFEVSAPTLREALRILESESLISIRRGTRGGVRIHQPTAAKAAAYAGLVLQSQGTTIGDLYDARALLEPTAVRLLAADPTAARVAELRRGVDLIRFSEDDREFVSHATQVHLRLIELTGNRTLLLIAAILESVSNATASHLAERLTEPLDRPAIVSSFDHLVDLIEAGNVERAERHWRRVTLEVARQIADRAQAIDVVDVDDWTRR